jgi:hypothetical protein
VHINFNILQHYGITNREQTLDINLTTNRINIPLLRKEDVQNKLANLKDKQKIGYVHIGAIQVMIKAIFREGIDTPIELALVDNRLIQRKDVVLGVIQGNLSCQKLKFRVHPKISVNLRDKNLNSTLSLVHDFKRRDFTKDGSIPYSIT